METEIWKDIPGYEGSYIISNFGRVKSLDRKVTMKNGSIVAKYGRELKAFPDAKGYSRAHLAKGNKNIAHRIHRLVLKVFLRPPVNNEECNHINGIKTDNRLENLEWLTPSENVKHAYKNGLAYSYSGEKHPNSKLTEDNVYAIKVFLNCGVSQAEIGRMYNVSQSNIGDIKRGRIWKRVQLLPSLIIAH